MTAQYGAFGGGLGRGTRKQGSADPREQHPLGRKYYYDQFEYVTTYASGGGATVGTANAITVLNTGNRFGVISEYANIGTISDALAPIVATDGLDVKCGNAASEGLEIMWGVQNGTQVRQRLGFKADVDYGFFAKLQLQVADVSGADVMFFGWRNFGAYDATFSNYTDYAALGWDGTDAAQTIDIFLSGGTGDLTAAAFATPRTLADATSMTWEVRVDGGGAVTCLVNERSVQSSAGAFKFDSGQLLIPFFRYANQSGAVAGAVILQSLEIGYRKPSR